MFVLLSCCSVETNIKTLLDSLVNDYHLERDCLAVALNVPGGHVRRWIVKGRSPSREEKEAIVRLAKFLGTVKEQGCVDPGEWFCQKDEVTGIAPMEVFSHVSRSAHSALIQWSNGSKTATHVLDRVLPFWRKELR